jgi:hypothetical protein
MSPSRTRRPIRTFLAVLPFVIMLSAAGPVWAESPAAPDTSARFPDPVVYLSWHSPYGMPRATEDLTPSHGANQRDTLWLTFEPRRTSKLFGMSAQIAFRAQPGDTLGDAWRFGGGTTNPHNIVVEFPQRSWPAKSPWSVPGFGGAHFDRKDGNGRLDIIFAVNADSAGPVENGGRYAFARILFPSMTTAEARQAVCIEWVSSEVSFAIGAPDAHPGRGGSPFASVSSPGCAVCRTYRDARRIAPIKPFSPLPGTTTPKH